MRGAIPHYRRTGGNVGAIPDHRRTNGGVRTTPHGRVGGERLEMRRDLVIRLQVVGRDSRLRQAVFQCAHSHLERTHSIVRCCGGVLIGHVPPREGKQGRLGSLVSLVTAGQTRYSALWHRHPPTRPDTNRLKRGDPRSGAYVGSIFNHAGER